MHSVLMFSVIQYLKYICKVAFFLATVQNSKFENNGNDICLQNLISH